MAEERFALVRTAGLLARSGVVAPMRPDRLARVAVAMGRFGLTLASAYAVAATRWPHRPAVHDERGTLTYREIDQRTDRLASAMADRGIGPGRCVAVLCRNHRGPIEVTVACAKLGADVVLLNTGLSGEQLRAVLAEHRCALLVADAEFATRIAPLPDGCLALCAWPQARADANVFDGPLEALVAEGGGEALPLRPPRGRLIVLTSGTTGAPKGARRPTPRGLGPAAAILSRIPVRSGEPALLSAPLFHAWGFAALQLASLHGQTLVLRRRFDPTDSLRLIAQHRITTMYAVPVMLQRILEIAPNGPNGLDTSSLRVVAVSGSAVRPALSERFMAAFGSVLYNLYGSTEVSWATIATPRDLRRAPGTAGRAPLGTVVRVLDEDGNPVPDGQEGRIFVGNDMLFEGYTRDGAATEVVGGLMSTGDVGRIDEHGLLHVTGRSDDMIVSGGENVHPGRVDELIGSWPEVRESVVVGVDDDEYGQRLAAYLVLEPGAGLEPETVRDRVRTALAGFAVPRDVVFVDTLPRNATGKIVTRELPPSR